MILSSGTPWWDYPGLLAVNPFFVLSLPFLPTLFMLLTSAGVGLGMSVAVILSIGLLRQRKSSSARPATVGTVTSLTPAMIALVTLGACCSTTAAATTGIGITAQATGTGTGTLLLNNWYFGVFQLVILYVALLAQEQLLRVYGSLVPSSSAVGSRTAEQPPLDRRFAAGATLRVLLLYGVTWCLVMLADWLTVNPATACAGTWVGWILQHQLIGFAAIFAALVPVPMYRAFLSVTADGSRPDPPRCPGRRGSVARRRDPPPLAASGWHGFVNELMAGTSRNRGEFGSHRPGSSSRARTRRPMGRPIRPAGRLRQSRWACDRCSPFDRFSGRSRAPVRPSCRPRPLQPGTDSRSCPESQLTLAPGAGR